MLRQPNCVPERTRFYSSGGYKQGYQMLGNGRDTYIANNNGGFTISHKVTSVAQPGNIYYPQNDVLGTLSKSPVRNGNRYTTVSVPKTSNMCPIKY
jgi:hypothetical protein